MSSRQEAGPLSGMRVLDMSTSYAGPTAGMYLAELGAQVIKVERPGRGDDARGWGPPFIGELSAWFASANRGKRSVALDLRAEGGKVVLERLLASADACIVSFNPAKLERLGLAPDTIRSAHPHLIYCVLSGYGLTGPDAGLPGYDLMAQARSGLMSVTGEKGGTPQRVSTALSDVVAGMAAALAISAARVRQVADGSGELIDISLLECDLALLAPRIASYLAGEPEPLPSSGTDSVISIYQSFETADRSIVVAVGNDDMWVRFAEALDLHELLADPALSTNEGRRAQREHLVQRVGAVLSERPASVWLERLSAVGIPAAPVQRLSEAVEDPQVVARETILRGEHDGMAVHGVRGPFRLASQPDVTIDGIPACGEHGVEILADVGFSSREISDLIESGAVAGGTSRIGTNA